jgi:hypothetical protein
MCKKRYRNEAEFDTVMHASYYKTKHISIMVYSTSVLQTPAHCHLEWQWIIMATYGLLNIPQIRLQ